MITWAAAERLKSALLIASGKQGLTNLLLEHIIFLSVAALGKIEQISASPSRLITNGQQIVASPMVAASRGTGTMYRTWEISVNTAHMKRHTYSSHLINMIGHKERGVGSQKPGDLRRLISRDENAYFFIRELIRVNLDMG
jgi:hypothetical protein